MFHGVFLRFAQEIVYIAANIACGWRRLQLSFFVLSVRPRPPNEAPAIIQFAITELVCGQLARNDVRGADGRRGTGAAEFLGHASKSSQLPMGGQDQDE